MFYGYKLIIAKDNCHNFYGQKTTIKTIIYIAMTKILRCDKCIMFKTRHIVTKCPNYFTGNRNLSFGNNIFPNYFTNFILYNKE